jgi:transcriptional regulator with XRE-family HTH domain
MSDTGRKIVAGSRLKRLRRELGLSQSGMAAELGLSASYLNLMERNQRPVTATVLIKLAEAYDVDPRSFAREEETRLAGELEEIFSDSLFRPAPVSRDELRDVAESAPSVADAIQRLYLAYVEARQRAAADLGSGDHDRGEGLVIDDPVDRVRDILQAQNNHFPELEERAEAIAAELAMTGYDVFHALSERLREKHGLRVQVLPVDVMPLSLRRFDHHRRRLMISELVEPAGRAFHAAYQLAFVEAGDAIDSLARRFHPAEGPAYRLFRVTLANYFAAALMMPYGRFLAAAEALEYDVEVLAARFTASYEQVAHRLTTLARPTARGVPFFLVRLDMAGNVSKRFSSGTFPSRALAAPVRAGMCTRPSVRRAES